MVVAARQLANDINAWATSEGIVLDSIQESNLLAAAPRMLDNLGATEEAFNKNTRIRIISSGRVGYIRGEGSVLDPATNSQIPLITFLGDDGVIERISDLTLIERE